MGSSSSNKTFCFWKQAEIADRGLYVQPNFYFLGRPKDRYLSQFRGKLLRQECGYILVALIHQYLLAMHNGIEVMVSDNLCKVTGSGLVSVISWQDLNLGIELVSNYQRATYFILKIVQGLCIGNIYLWQGQLGFLKQQLLEVILNLSNSERQGIMFQQLLRLIEAYMKGRKISCSLKAALARDQPTQYSPIWRHPVMEGKIAPKSSLVNQQHITNAYSQAEWARRQEGWNPKQNVKFCNLSLSSQYSFHFRFQTPQQKNIPSKHSIARSCIRKRYATVMLRQSCSPEINSTAHIDLYRNNTSINLNSSRRHLAARKSTKVKTVLDTMARLVEVREEPSSKSIIC